MAQRKCPACGGRNSGKILYCMPIHEASEAADSEKLC